MQILYFPEEKPTETVPTTITDSTTTIHTTGEETTKPRTHFNWEEVTHLIMK